MKDLPQRKRLRLQGYNYSQNGAYFITICTKDRVPLFGEIKNGVIELNQNGLAVQTNIEKLSGLYQGITVDQSVIMPNHIHMVITICRERIVCVPNNDTTKSQLSKIIQVFKSSVTKGIRNSAVEGRNAYNAFPTVWQSHFHDHIIRDEREYQKIWEYIDTNPQKWQEDCFYIQ